MTRTDVNASDLQEQVREHYAAAAKQVTRQVDVLPVAATCCAAGPELIEIDPFGAARYDAGDRAELPAAAVAVSLGCGNPTAVLDLDEGEVVLDLGSGGGIDVILSARRVGVTGKAYGLDMTDEMLELARRNAAEANVDNAEFLQGTMEDIPLPDASVDVVISNCVINLSIDKAKVFAEIARVLRPGGRLGVSDIVAEDRLSPAERAERGGFAGCIAGALSVTEYMEGLDATGFENTSVSFTHEIVDGLHGAIVRASKPRWLSVQRLVQIRRVPQPGSRSSP